jgi:arylsulfatase A-like enzyme
MFTRQNRKKQNTVGVLILLGAHFLSVAEKPPAVSSSKPNILMIFTDDQRFDSIGYDNPEIQTPNLDKLAKRGVIFNNCFVNTSICCVSRANIMTGQYPMRHGVTDFFKTLTREQLDQTYPALLRQAGYYTGIVGKWGIGHTVENTYTALPAFDFWAGASHQTLYWHDADCDYVTKNGADNICTCGKAINKDGVGPGGHQSSYKHLGNPLHTDTDIFPMKVKQFLNARDPDKPFCLSLFYKAPHGPEDGWDRFKFEDLYEGVTFTLPETATKDMADTRPAFLRSDDTMLGVKGGYNYLAQPDRFQLYVRNYNRLITGMDYSVGKVMDILKEAGLADNTVVLFTSDNGHFNLDHGFLGKWLMYEPSLRVPGFAFDPRLPENLRRRRIDPMVTTLDYTATILDLAGVNVPDTMQGYSFLPLLVDETPAFWQTEFFYEHPYGHGGHLPLIHGVRTDRYKYTRYISQTPPFEELFDLKNDPNETRNLAESPEYGSLLEQLRRKTDEYEKLLK